KLAVGDVARYLADRFEVAIGLLEGSDAHRRCATAAVIGAARAWLGWLRGDCRQHRAAPLLPAAINIRLESRDPEASYRDSRAGSETFTARSYYHTNNRHS